MLAGAPSWGAHILHFFAQLPYTKTNINKEKCKLLQNTESTILQKQSYSTLLLHHDAFEMFQVFFAMHYEAFW